MYYANLLPNFKIEWDTYEKSKNEDDPDVPVINDKNNYCKVIRFVYIFTDCIYWTYGSRGNLFYVLQESSSVTSEVYDA